LHKEEAQEAQVTAYDEYIAEEKRIAAIGQAAKEVMETASKEVRALTLIYLREHPLSNAEAERLRDRVREGHSFCCDTGLAWLESAVGDKVWRRVLNKWAYERLGGCKPGTADTDPIWLRNLERALSDIERFLGDDDD
jgi:hypothetical protein